jgi:hypothetical protein
MIVVTLFCVLLGGLRARIEYLRRLVAFHQDEARAYSRLHLERNLSPIEEERALDATTEHLLLARDYYRASYRPWMVVDELRYRRHRPPNSSAPAPNPPKP